MKTATRLIVLNVTKIGETKAVVHALTSDFGRRSFIAGVSRRGAMTLFLPLNILDAEVTENPRSDLWRLGAVTVTDPLSGIRGNLYKNTMTLFMSEVLYRTVRDGVYEESLFDWCVKSIKALDAIQSDFSNFHLRFLLELAAALGFRPEASDLAPFAGKYYAQVKDLVSLDFASSMLLPLSGESRNAIAELLLQYLSRHTESAINVQSLKVLRELYA